MSCPICCIPSFDCYESWQFSVMLRLGVSTACRCEEWPWSFTHKITQRSPPHGRLHPRYICSTVLMTLSLIILMWTVARDFTSADDVIGTEWILFSAISFSGSPGNKTQSSTQQFLTKHCTGAYGYRKIKGPHFSVPPKRLGKERGTP